MSMTVTLFQWYLAKTVAGIALPRAPRMRPSLHAEQRSGSVLVAAGSESKGFALDAISWYLT